MVTICSMDRILQLKEDYYRLKVLCNPPPQKKSYIEILTSNVMALGGGDFEEVIRS